MSRRIRSTAVAVLASLAMVTMGSTASFAQDPYPPFVAFGVTCVSAGQAGASVTCTVVGANDGEVLVWAAAYGSRQIDGGSVTANAEGEATFRFTVPVQARGQAITVTVTREDGTSATDSLTIAAPGRTGEVVRGGALARTGQDAILLGAGGLVLLAGGILALRRRKADERIDA